MSSTEAAPVSAAGEMRVRPKADGTTLQLSYATGAWFDMGASGGGGSGTVRLDQVLNPDIPITDPPTARIKAFSMTDHQLAFQFSGAESEECFVIETAADAPGSGAVLLLRSQGSMTNKAPLRIEGRNQFYMTVAADGKVAIGAETGLVHKLNVYHTNTGGTNFGVIHGSVSLGAGNTAATMTGSNLRVTDAGNTTALLSLKNVDFSLDRDSSAVSNTSLVCTNVDVNSNINANTLTLRSLELNIQVHGSTLTNWEALRIAAPGTSLGGAVTNRRAIITASGAGNVGFGTLTPAAQLHVVGTVQFDQRITETTAWYKTIDANEAITLAFYRAKATAPGDLDDGFGIGSLVFHSPVSGVMTQSSYVRSFVSTAAGNVIHVGAGAIDQARLAVSQSATIGTAGLIAGANYFQVRSDGFQFSHGTTGAVYYRDAAGYLVPTAALFNDPTPGNPDDEGKVLTVTNVSGVLLPTWQVPPGAGSSGLPASPVSTLQFNNAGAFGAVTSSLVSGANVTLGGVLTLSAATALTHIIEKTTDVASGTLAGQITFRKNLSGTTTDFGYLRAYQNDTGGNGAVIELGKAADKRFTLSAVTTEMQFGSHYVQLLTGGIRVSTGIDGGVFYQASGSFVSTVAGTTSQYLKGGTTPTWGSLDASHITAGVVALARGGTGASLADPGADKILFWDDSAAAGAGAVTWLTIGANLAIDGATNTLNAASASGGVPATPFSTLQYNNAGAFGALSNSIVSGSNLTLGGDLTVCNVTSDDMSVLVSATGGAPSRVIFTDYRDAAAGSQLTFERGRISGSTHTALIGGDVVSRILWRGQLPTVGVVMMGYLHCWNDLAVAGGSRVDLGAGSAFGDTRAKVSISDTGTNGSVTLFGGGGTSVYFQVQAAGLNTSEGGVGALFYKIAGNYLVPTASPAAADQIAFWDNSAGQVRWLTLGTNLSITDTTINAAGGGGTPATPVSTLQFNNAGAFGAVTSSVVSGANLTLGGDLTFDRTNAATTVTFNRLGAALGHGDVVANLYFKDAAGSFTGILRSYYDTFSGGNQIEIGQSSSARINVTTSAIAANLNNHGLLIDTSKTRMVRANGNYFEVADGWLASNYLTTFSSSMIQTHTRTLDYAGTAAVGFGMREAFQLKSSTTASRLAAAMDTRWQNATDATRSAVMSFRTVHKGQTVTNERMVLGGYKDLVDNTLTDLFSITFGTTDHVAGGGEVHMVFVAKQVSGSIQTHVYRRTITFIFGHNGATNTSMFNVRELSSAQASAASDGVGLNAISHAINADSAVSLATAIPANPNVIATNAITYKILVDTSLTTISQLTCYYHIIYHGEADITLA